MPFHVCVCVCVLLLFFLEESEILKPAAKKFTSQDMRKHACSNYDDQLEGWCIHTGWASHFQEARDEKHITRIHDVYTYNMYTCTFKVPTPGLALFLFVSAKDVKWSSERARQGSSLAETLLLEIVMFWSVRESKAGGGGEGGQDMNIAEGQKLP